MSKRAGTTTLSEIQAAIKEYENAKSYFDVARSWFGEFFLRNNSGNINIPVDKNDMISYLGDKLKAAEEHLSSFNIVVDEIPDEDEDEGE